MSLKEIADTVGCSVSTVSRVLGGRSPQCAGRELQDKIRRAAREQGYVPNIYARALKKGGEGEKPRYRVAVVLYRLQELSDDPFFQELYRFVEQELFRSRCEVRLVTRPTGESVQQLEQADGVVLLGRCDSEHIRNIRRGNRNVVGLWRNPVEGEIDQVFCSGERAAARAVEYLAGLGHRDIAYMGDCSAEGRFVGYTRTLLELGIPIRLPLVYETDQTEKQGEAAMERLLADGRATAVLCANDATALGALRTLAGRRGRQTPVSVVAIDNIEASAWSEPMLTTMNIPRRDMAHLGVEVLLDRIARGHEERVSLELPSRLVERDSCYVNSRTDF